MPFFLVAVTFRHRALVRAEVDIAVLLEMCPDLVTLTFGYPRSKLT